MRLVPRSLCVEVTERLGPHGEVLTPLDTDELLRGVERLLEAGVESLAVVFLHAYANPAHERAAVEALAARYPQLSVSPSHEVAPERSGVLPGPEEHGGRQRAAADRGIGAHAVHVDGIAALPLAPDRLVGQGQ